MDEQNEQGSSVSRLFNVQLSQLLILKKSKMKSQTH